MSKYFSDYPSHNIVINDATLIRLKTLLTEAESCEFDLWDDGKNNDFLGKNGHSRLRISIPLYGTPSFVISVVNLVNRHQGTMTKIFEIVKEFCLQNGVKTIIIQSVGTEEMMQWCQKFGFTRRDDGWWLRDV